MDRCKTSRNSSKDLFQSCLFLPKKIRKAKKGSDSGNEIQETEGQTAECLNEGAEVVKKLGADFSAVAAKEWGRDECGKIGDPEDETIL